MKQFLRRFFLLLLAFFLYVPAFASDGELHIPKEKVKGQSFQVLMTEFMDDHFLTEKNFSVYYYNTVTQEEYRFNETRMMTAASTYKFPLNMYYYELEQAGERSDEDYFLGHSLADCHYQSIVWSDNELSQEMLYALGSFRTYKDCMRKYFTMTDEEIDHSYYEGNNYCTRMMMDALRYFYDRTEQLPELLDYMKQALPGEYFKKYVTDVEIAHKYGTYEGAENDVGIFYTEQPFLLAVYTQDVGVEVVSEAAALCRTYNECKYEADLEAEEAERQQRLIRRQIAEQAALGRAEDRTAQEELRRQREAAEAEQKEKLLLEEEQKKQEALTERSLPEQPKAEEPTVPKEKTAFVWWMPVVAMGVFGVGALLLSTRAKRRFSLIEELEREEEEAAREEEERQNAPK